MSLLNKVFNKKNISKGVTVLSFPFLLNSCSPDNSGSSSGNGTTTEILTEKSKITDSEGKSYFTDNSTLEEVVVEVMDQHGFPLPNTKVNFTDGEGYEIFWLRNLKNNHIPTLGIYAHNSKHIIEMRDSGEGIYEIYILDENNSLGEVVWKWRNTENLSFSTYGYEKTINKDEYLGIQERGGEVVNFLWQFVEYFLGISSVIKPNEIAKFLSIDEKGLSQRWDIYNVWDNQNKFFTLIPSNIPSVEINNFEINDSEISVSWEGTDKDTYDQFVFMPDNKDLTKYIDGNSTSDLEYSYKIMRGNITHKDWSGYGPEKLANINIRESGNYTLELRVKDEVDNIGKTSRDFSIDLGEGDNNSGDESKILYLLREGSGDRDIWVMNSDGSNPIKLAENCRYPSWSYDKKNILFNKSYSIYIMNSNGSNQRLLSNNIHYGYSPVMSPNGERVAFVVPEVSEGYSDICITDIDGTNKNCLNHKEGKDGSPSWSPDGTKITFHSNRKNSSISGKFWEIYVMNSDGSNVHSLTNNNFMENNPSWSPDGTKIIFTSHRDGNGEIYIMNSDGSNQKNLTNIVLAIYILLGLQMEKK